MERVTLDQLSTKANISTDLSKEGFLSRQQRLQRWTELLAREPDRPLNTFLQTEYMDAEARDSLRCADSALTVAFQDPVLREAGLTDDSYGTAKRFFGLGDRHLHWILCYCHHGMSVRAGALVSVLRSILKQVF
ncbi:MAG TPA: hypothetical protein VIS03_00290 [Kiloniellaceae bacterium]